MSPFHRTFGFYVDGVELEASVLPDGWETRVVVIETPNTNGFRGLCLEPTDLAVTKLVASRPKDLEFVRVLVRERIVSPETLRARLAGTPKLDADRRGQLQQLVAQLT